MTEAREQATAGMAKADLLVVGGGINGVGIARDAAGRGLRVVLCEQADLASATSSVSRPVRSGPNSTPTRILLIRQAGGGGCRIA